MACESLVKLANVLRAASVQIRALSKNKESEDTLQDNAAVVLDATVGNWLRDQGVEPDNFSSEFADVVNQVHDEMWSTDGSTPVVIKFPVTKSKRRKTR
jgi:hypothetical protein